MGLRRELQMLFSKFQQVQSSEKKYKAKSIAEEYNKCM